MKDILNDAWEREALAKSDLARKEIATLGDDLTAAADRIIEEVRQTNPDMAEYLETSDPSGREPMKWAEWMLRANIPPSQFEEMYVKTLPQIGSQPPPSDPDRWFLKATPKQEKPRAYDPNLPSWRQCRP